MSTLPSAFRGTPAVGYFNHCAARRVDASGAIIMVRAAVASALCRKRNRYGISDKHIPMDAASDRPAVCHGIVKWPKSHAEASPSSGRLGRISDQPLTRRDTFNERAVVLAAGARASISWRITAPYLHGSRYLALPDGRAGDGCSRPARSPMACGGGRHTSRSGRVCVLRRPSYAGAMADIILATHPASAGRMDGRRPISHLSLGRIRRIKAVDDLANHVA